ncbi:MAG: glycosyltransferase family 39 protein [bacterium]|nr:glycosyltransferase family 39 protein [bacterium]
MINLLISLALIYVIFVAAYRMLVMAGAPFQSKNAKVNLFLGDTKELSETPTTREYIFIAFEAFAFRIIVYVVSAFALALFAGNGQNITISSFVDSWHQWDASNYIRIATGGYNFWMENGEPTTLVFFPLYAWAIKIAYFFIRDYDISALFVSTICYVGGIVYMYGFVSLEYGKSIAKKAVIYLSIFPFGFFFGAMMPESVFLFTASAFFYYLKKHNWTMVALFGMASSLSRMQGILLIIPAGIEWLDVYKPIKKLMERKKSEFFRSLLVLIPVLFTAVGTLIYLFLNYLVAGNCFKFLELQENVWGHHYEYVGKAVTTIFNYLCSDHYTANMKAALWLPQAAIVVLTIGLLIYAANKHKPQYILYLTAYTIISFSASFILSGGRYMSVAIPLFIILAKLLDKHERSHRAFVAINLLLMALYTAGYVFGKQIM